jgi:hypothetical protein
LQLGYFASLGREKTDLTGFQSLSGLSKQPAAPKRQPPTINN